MGKAKRFNTYDSSVSESRKQAQQFGQQRQDKSGIGSSFRSPLNSGLASQNDTSTGVANSPLTTKGDLWGYDTADNRIPVGVTNGHVLTVDSAVALGVKWAAGGGSVGFPIEPTVTDNGAGWTGSQTLNLNTGDGHIYKWTVDQDLTFMATVSNVPASGTQRTFELEFVHDEVGGTFTVTLPTSPSFVDEDGATLSTFVLSTGRAILSCRVNEGSGGDIIVLQKNVAATAAAIGATKELDNLTTTAINASLIPDTDVAYDLGSSANSWDSVWNRYIRFDTDVAAPSSGHTHKISTGTVGMHFNVNQGADKFVFYHNGTSSSDINSSGLSVVDSVTVGDGTSGQGKLIINDSTSTISPVNGYVYREGGDVKVYSGGSERNLSDIGVAAGGANVALSNLSTTAINTDLLFDAATHNIGDTTNPVLNVFAKSLRLQSGVITVNKPMITSVGGNSVDINHPAGSGVNFSEQGATAAVIIDGGGLITSNNLILQTALSLNDTTSYPGVNGDIYREGTDVKIYSGGSEVNISSLGSGTPPFDDTSALVQNASDNTKTFTINLINNSTGDANLLSSFTTASRTWVLPDATTTLAGLAVSQIFTGATNTFTNDVVFEDDVTLGASSVDNIDFNGQMISDIKYEFGFTTNFNASQSSVGSAGSASDLPSKPTGYIVIKVTDTEYVVPYYDKS